MQLITVNDHQGESKFPLFPKGTAVKILAECENYPNWLSAEIEGHFVYVPDHFIEKNQLVIDYNPTELVVEKGEVVELLELHYEWALVQKENEIGWLPCKILRNL